MNRKNDKYSKIKEIFNKLKEAWNIPYKKAGIKLLAYLIFFMILFMTASITSRMSYKEKNIMNNSTTTRKIIENNSLSDKYKKLSSTKLNVNYVLSINDTEYKINGILESGIINGYLEVEDNIKKILFTNNELYEIKNNIKIKLDIDIIKELLNIEYIFNLIKDINPVIEKAEDNNNYFYTAVFSDKDINIKIYTNENTIYKIELQNEELKYTLNFDNI